MKKKHHQLIEEIGVHTFLIIASLIAIFPVLWLISTSFKPESEIFTSNITIAPQNFTWDNYKYVLNLKDGIFFTWVRNSIVVALSTTILGLFFATTAAYAFSRYNFPGKRGMMYSFLLTQMFPGALLIVPYYNLFKQLGLLNSYTGLILAYSTTALPFCVWMLKQYFDTIPFELEEAARVDGLGPWGTFYKIVLPLSVPSLAVTAFFSFITAWNEFMFALTFMNREELYTIPVGLRSFVYYFRTDWHFMAAGAIMITIPVLIFFFFMQKYLVSGLTAGGSKG